MHVAVLGGGIVGLSTAWALVKRGHAVTLIEQAPSIPNPYSASADEHRLMRHAYGLHDGYALMIAEALEAWRELWQDLGHRHFVPCGVLVVSQTAGDEAEIIRDGLDRNGQAYDCLNPEQAAIRFPFLDSSGFRYALFCNEGGVLLSRRIARDLVCWLNRSGVSIKTGTKVVALNQQAARVELANGEAILADKVVVALGAWTLDLVPDLAGTLRIFRNAVAYLEPPPDLNSCWRHAPGIIDIGGSQDGYVLPPVMGTRLKVACGSHKRRIRHPDDERDALPAEGQQIQRLFSPPLARLAEYQVIEVSTCVYTFTCDSRFFATGNGPTVIVSACSGHGYKFGAAIGRRIAIAVEDGDIGALVHWLGAGEPA